MSLKMMGMSYLGTGREFPLQEGERVLRSDATQFFKKRLNSAAGLCFLTNQRVVTFSSPLLVWSLGLVSGIGRAVLKRLGLWLKSRQEGALRDLMQITLSNYGPLQRRVTLHFRDGVVIRIGFQKGDREQWLATLDEALAEAGLQRVEEGEAAFKVVAAGHS